MVATFIQGFLAEVVIDGADTTPITATVSLNRSRTAIDKAVMDSIGDSVSIPGMRSGVLSLSGHVSTAELNVLEASYAKEVPVAFTVKVVEGLASDAEWVGEFVFETFDIDTSADGNWAFSVSGPTSGPVAYTPAAP